MTALPPGGADMSLLLKRWASTQGLGDVQTIAEIPTRLRERASTHVAGVLGLEPEAIDACFEHWDEVAAANEAAERALNQQLGGSPHEAAGDPRKMEEVAGLTRKRRAAYRASTSSLGSLKRLEISPRVANGGPEVSFVCDDAALMFMVLGQLKHLERDGATDGLHPSLKDFLGAANERLRDDDWALMSDTVRPQLSVLERHEDRRRFDALADTRAFRRLRSEARSFQLRVFDAWETTGPRARSFMKALTGLSFDHRQTVFTLHPKHPGGTNRDGDIYLGAPPWWAQRFDEPMLAQLWHEILHSVVPGIDDVSHATIELAEDALSEHLHGENPRAPFVGHDYLEPTRDALRSSWAAFEADTSSDLHEFIQRNQDELGITHAWKDIDR